LTHHNNWLTLKDGSEVSCLGPGAAADLQPDFSPENNWKVPFMSAPASVPWGTALSAADYENLAARSISRELADAAGLRRVDSLTGQLMFHRKQGDCSGILIPNIAPWDGSPREYRLRLDHPPLEQRKDGTIHEGHKYLQPPGRPNLLYFPPGITQQTLDDPAMPVMITEGEFKALALWGLANYGVSTPRFLPVAVPGVWNWRGTIGKAPGPNGERRDVRGVIPDIELIVWKNRRVIVAYDADAGDNPSVRAARSSLSSELRERCAQVGFLAWPLHEGKGIDDRLASVGSERVLADIANVDYQDWRARLLYDFDGLLACYENVALFLENSPDWDGALGYNEFTGGYHILRVPPRPIKAKAGAELDDRFDTEAVRYFECHGMMVQPHLVHRVVDSSARQNSFHPVRDYLNSLPKWDGVPRLRTWLIDYCGVESSDTNPNVYAMAVGEKFLISAVARIMQPGAKCDHMLVLEGPQGSGKSTAARILAGDDWFTDQLADMGSKDASMQLRGVWLVELSELDALNRAEIARAKAFLTQQTARFRVPYGRRVETFPRQCVFFGTTNASEWLKDETGGRRFWPVRSGQIDLEALRRDRDQLWAEALQRYRDGETWWLDDAETAQDAVREQSDRYQQDVWMEPLAKWLESPYPRLDPHGPAADFSSSADSVTIPDILHHALGKLMPQWTHSDKIRIANCLTRLGWEKRRVGPKNSRQYRYFRRADGRS
jgi:predicted P-loop ATPase